MLGSTTATSVTRWPYADGLAKEKTHVVVSTVSAMAKVAVTALLPSMVIAMGLVLPLSSPLHPVKSQPASAVAVRVTTVPYV